MVADCPYVLTRVSPVAWTSHRVPHFTDSNGRYRDMGANSCSSPEALSRLDVSPCDAIFCHRVRPSNSAEGFHITS